MLTKAYMEMWPYNQYVDYIVKCLCIHYLKFRIPYGIPWGIPYDRDENATLEPYPQPTVFCFSRLSLGKFNCSPSSSDPPLLCNHLLLKFLFADNLLPPPPPPSHMSNLSVCLWGRGFVLLREDLANSTGSSFEIFRSEADILVS